MKSIRSRLILVLILIALGVYYLYPTLKYDQLSRQEQVLLSKLSDTAKIPLKRLATEVYRDEVDFKAEIEASDLDAMVKSDAISQLEFIRGDFLKDIKNYRPRAIKLGLDLQGGMYLVLEVDLVQMLDNQAKGKDEAYERLIADLRLATSTGEEDVFVQLRNLAARDRVSLSRFWGAADQSDASIIKDMEKQSEDAVDRSLEILRNRIDQFGVSEPSISKLGTRRIQIQLPGVKDPVRARELVGRTAMLEFKLVIDAERARTVLTGLDNAIAARMRGEALIDTTGGKQDTTKLASDSTKTDTTKLAADTTAADTSAKAHPLLTLLVGGTNDILVAAENRSAVTRMITSKEFDRFIPRDVHFVWSAKSRIMGDDKKEFWSLYVVKRQADMTGSLLANAQSSIGSGYDPEQAGKPVVTMEFTSEGSRVFARTTGANVGKRMAIVLDNKIYMAPNIKDKISGGNAIITGLTDMPEARDISIVLRAGALPAPVHVVEERTVGPSLGQDSVEAGKTCLLLSFLAVTLFMIWYYRLSGGIADLAMIINQFLLLGILAMFQFTLTMPGIAGIILTIGMAVDANVLIYERIREELRLGKTVRAAIDTGFTRAIAVIIDANVTTAFSGVALLMYGSGSIKGFALTLTVGVMVNVFSAVVVTRLVYDMSTSNRQLKSLSI